MDEFEVSIVTFYYCCLQYLLSDGILREEFEDTKGVIKIRNSKKDRQRYGQMKTDKRYNKMTNKTHGHK
jgi:hypothetical protein